MTEARRRWALGLLVIAPGGPVGAPQCGRLGSDQLVAENEDVVVFSSSHHSAARRRPNKNRYPHKEADLRSDQPPSRKKRRGGRVGPPAS
jgi:hypothetical protein